jgi:MFS family permease
MPNDNQRTARRLTKKQRRRSITFAMLGAISAVTGGCCVGGNVLNLAVLKLGASEVYLGVLSFVTMGSWCFRVFTMSAIERVGKRRVMLFWYWVVLLFILPFVFIPFLARLWPPWACLALLLIASLGRNITYALGNTGWFPLLQDVVPRQITGRFFANMRTGWQTASLITILVCAFFLGRNPEWWKFQVIFIFGFLAYLLRAFSIIPLAENPPQQARREQQPGIAARFRETFGVPEMRILIFYIFTYMLAATMTEPFKIKLLKDLGYTYRFILAAAAMIGAGAIISLRPWGKLADRFGNRFIFTIAHIGLFLCSLCWLLVGRNQFSPVLAFALFFLWSLFHSGNGIAQTRYIMHTVPVGKQNYITIINVFLSLAAGLAPLLGGLFLAASRGLNLRLGPVSFNNYDFLFVVAALLFVLPHRFYKKLQVAHERPTMQVIGIVTRPLRNIFGPFFGINSHDMDES